MRACHVHARGALRVCAALLALAFAPLLATAQQAPVISQGFAPFASRLKAEAVDYQIKLTWKDAPDTAGTYLVYRSPQEITSKNIGTALMVGKVDTGVQFYLDTPPDGGRYYYAVMLQAAGGKLYTLLIPFRNMTSVPVSTLSAAPEEKLAARITDLKAVVTPAGDAVQITFRSSNPGRDLLLFRGTAPLLQPEDLLRSVSATQLDPGTTRYLMPALGGVDYWFAVLDAELYKVGQAPLKKGVNTSDAPVQVPVGSGRISLAPPSLVRRALPLPSLRISADVQSGQPLGPGSAPVFPAEKRISPATAHSLALLRAELPQPVVRLPRPQVLASDTTPMPSGELQRLREIVTGPFLGGDMTGTEKMLLDFLSLPRKPDIEAHARFYLGQTYFIEGRKRDAFMQFLLAQDVYYRETRPWLDACFDALLKADR